MRNVGSVVARMRAMDAQGRPMGTQEDAVAVMDPASFIMLLAMEQDETVTVEGHAMTVRHAMEWLVDAHETENAPAIHAGRPTTIGIDALARNGIVVTTAPRYALAFVSRLRRVAAENAVGMRLRTGEAPPEGLTDRRAGRSIAA